MPSLPPPLEPWRTLAKRHAAGTVLPWHQHRSAQLVFATSGVMHVDAGEQRWIVPPQRALWIAAHEPHSIRMLSVTELRTVYFDPAWVAGAAAFARCGSIHVVQAPALVRELVLGLCDSRRSPERRERAARLLMHELAEAGCQPTHLPLPASADLRRTALSVLARQAWDRTRGDAADEAAVSERSFSRRFTAEVGMSFRSWRQRARLVASLDLLARGEPVKVAAHHVGYRSMAAYSTAFAALFGAPPQDFRGGRALQGEGGRSSASA